MATRTESSGIDITSSLPPGNSIFRCNAQDITRKGSKKSRHQIIMVLPQQFAFQKGQDYELGVLENANTNSPSFLIKTANGVLKFTGRYVSTSTSFFSIECLPKYPQSVVSDLYHQLLVFDEPSFIANTTSPSDLSKSKESITFDCLKSSSAESIRNGSDVQHCASETSIVVDGSESKHSYVPWTLSCGISSLADPIAQKLSSKLSNAAPSPVSSERSSDQETHSDDEGRTSRRPVRYSAKNLSFAESSDESNDGSVVGSKYEQSFVEENTTRARIQRTTKSKKHKESEDESSPDFDSDMSSSEEYVEIVSKKRKRKSDDEK